MKNTTKSMVVKESFLKIFTGDFIFRLGLSIFFLTNSLAAWFSPDEFLELLKTNLLASAIANPPFWIYVIGINDALLFLFILSGRWRKYIAVWASLWIILVMYVTVPEGAIEFIEHIGILALISYYYFAFQRVSAKQLK